MPRGQASLEEYLSLLEGLKKDFRDPGLRCRLLLLFERFPARPMFPVQEGNWVRWFEDAPRYFQAKKTWQYAKVERVFRNETFRYSKHRLHFERFQRATSKHPQFFKGDPWWENATGHKAIHKVEVIPPPDCVRCGAQGEGLYQDRIDVGSVEFYCRACAEQQGGIGVSTWGT